jgi:hypothetical protein
MFIITAILTIANTLINAVLTALSTRPAGALLTTPTIELWNATTGTLTPNSTYGQFTKTTFSGYAAVALTLTGPVTINPTTQGMIANASFVATSASPFVPDTILGYMLTDGVSALYAFERFANPVPIPAPGAFIDLSFVFPLTNTNAG